MTFKKFLLIFSSLVIFAMLVVTTWASLHENVFAGGAKIIAEPWGVATLFDTYFAFLFFYLWVFYKENSITAKLVWFFAIILLGNFAMAFYMILQIHKLKNKDGIDQLLIKK